MPACRSQNEILMLDALGELNDLRQRRDWEEHLKACGGCRRERARLLALLGRVRHAGMPPELSAEQADAMAKTVGWRLRNERIAARRETGRRFRLRPVPALAAACAIVVVVWGGYRLQQHLGGDGSETELTAGLMAPEDLEVIKNFDLLKDMDTIEKLIHVVDLPDNATGTEPAAPETQGMMPPDESGKKYA